MNPFDQFDAAQAAKGVSGNPFDQFDAEKEQDNPLVRGWNKMVGSVGITKSLATSNYDETAQKIDEAARYQAANPGSKEGNELMAAWQRGNEKPVDGESVTDQIARTARNTKTGAANVAGEFAKDWNEAPGVVSGIRETAKNVGAMGAGVVEQVPNMLLPMAGMFAGGAAGSQAGPIGTIGGAWLGASAGNTLVEGGGMAQEALQKAGINPSDKAAVKAYFEKNGDALLAQAGIKGGIIGAVDTATMGIASKLLTAPGKAAAGRAMADMGVDVTDKVAVKAAMQSPELAARVASDPAYRAATTGVQGAARNTAAAALEPAGEFAGELVGQGVATGEWDVQNAALEAASSIGQSGATFAGQKAYAGLKYPFKANADQAAQLPDTGPMSRSANTAIASGAAADAASVLGVPADAEQAGEQIAPKSMDAIGRVQQIDQQIQSADPEQAATMKAERDQITASWPRAVSGAPTSFSTESGARIDGNYALMEAHELVTSHDEKLKPNPAYPREMQPRERDRAASEMQISAIVQRLDPARLGESGDAGTGAPIVGADGLVESGNARTIALKRAYQGNPEKAEAYRQYLADNAARFGVTPEAVASMNTPVLVRVRNTPVDRAEFARQANASTVAQMSSSEQARADAARIDDMGDMRPDDNGDFATSRDFIRRFVSRLPATEQGSMIDARGQLSQSGYARIRNAVLAKAYGDSPVLARMTESLDDNLRNVGRALMQAAPAVAKVRQDVNEGALFDADITPDLLAAVEELSRIKDSGRSIADYLAQVGMFGDSISPEARELLQFLADNLRRPRKIAEFIQRYTEALRAAGNPNQGSLLGATQAPSKRDIINAAWERENETAGQGGQPQGNQGAGQETVGQRGGTPGDRGGAQGNEAAAGQEWVIFPPETGTLGIPRAEMPQVKGEHRGALIAFLKGQGIDYTTHDMPADEIKPTQAEFSIKKATRWGEVRDGVDRSVLVSSDGYILDGHHQWIAALAAGENVKAITFNAPIKDLLTEVHQFPSVQRSEGAANDTGQAKAREDFQAALADLGVILRDFAQVARMVPEDTPDLMPTLVKLFESGIQVVGFNMKALVAHVKKAAKANETTKRIWNKISDAIYLKAARQAVENVMSGKVQANASGQQDMFAAPVAPAQQDLFTQPDNAPARKHAGSDVAVDQKNGAKTDALGSKIEAKQDKPLSKRAAMARSVMENGGYWRKALETDKYTGREQFHVRLRDKSGAVMPGYGFQTHDEMKGAGLLMRRDVPRSTAWAEEWVLRDKALDSSADQPRAETVTAPDKSEANKIVIDQVEYDADAPNFGLPEAPITLKDGDPLLVETYLKPADSMVVFNGETVTRAEMRQSIEDGYFSAATPAPWSRKPIAYVMGGGGASGKGFVKKHLIKTGSINETGAVSLDPDEVKPDIPEYGAIVAAGDSRAAAVTHEESSDIAKRIKARAIAGRYDIVLDVTLGDQKKGEKYLQELKDAGYEVRLFGVTVNPEAAVIRAMIRAQKTGRYVPISALLHAHRGFNGAFEAYAKIADEAVLFDNTTERQEIARATGGKLVVSNHEAYNGVAERSQINERARTLREISSGSVENAQRDELGRVENPRGENERTSGKSAEGLLGKQAGPEEADRSGSSLRRSGMGNELGNSQSGSEGGLNEHGRSGAQRPEGTEHGTVQQPAAEREAERVSGRADGRNQGRGAQPATGDRQGARDDREHAADGAGRNPENGGRAGARRGVRRDAGIPAGRDIPVKTGRNYAFGDADLTYEGSWLAKARQNVEALELLKQLEKDGRQASRDEQAVLAKFIGWGSSDLANSLFGDKLTKQLKAISDYDDALAMFERAGKDSLYRGGRSNGYYKAGDTGYYAAFNVLNAKADGKLNYYDPALETITRKQIEAAKPDMAAKKWSELRDRIKSALTPDEWNEASRSTQYAHYTSKPVVKAMWSALERMGFKGGAILEPGAGIGVFPGLMASGMANNSIYTGIEFDSITGGILKQLFPDERILVESFIDSKLPKNFYDVAAGNPPFNNTAILADPAYKKYAFALHDYFFAKSIDSVKPGGLVMFVTSRYTMDKLNDKARAYLAERADLVGAIRLPQTAFKKNAGTDVVTDVLFLRKKVDGETFEHAKPWAKSVPMKVGSKSFPVNEYFHAHPDMVLGKPSDKGKMANSPEPQYTVEAIDGDIDALFEKAAASLPANIYKAERGGAAEAAAVRELDFNPKAKKEGNFYVTDAGVLMQLEGGVGVRAEEKYQKNAALIKDFVGLRDALKQAHYDQLNEGEWENSLAALQKSYRAFVKQHGQVNQFTEMKRTVKVEDPDTGETIDDERSYKRFPLLSKIDDDPDYTSVMALESINEETGNISESAFLTDRVLGKPAQQEIRTPADALLSVLNDIGHVDIDAIADRLGMENAEVVDALGTMVYEDPAAGWVMADEYLSGNVKKKLAAAQEAVKSDRRFTRNIDALLAVQPVPVAPSEITVAIGMNWIPEATYEQFLLEKTGIRAKVNYNERTGQWSVVASSSTGTLAATQEWGTPRRSADDILLAALTGAPIRITETVKESGGSSKTVFLADATEAANQKLAQMREAFRDWMWQDAGRTDKLVALYNDTFNTIVPRAFDGRHLTLPGTSQKWKVFDHVKRGAWRIIQSGNTYLAHAVGSGKTFEMIISAMEQKRLGLIKKPMMVVPNHMLQQFAREWIDLYPAARLMVADEKNFHTENRRRFSSRVAMSDLDGVIITHSAFKLLDLDPAFKQKMIEQELDFLRAAFDEAGGEEGKKSRDPKIKQIESKIEKMEQKLEAAMSGAGKDKNVRFDEMGVDMVYVDEAHEFRKLAFATQRQVKGIDSSGSDRAFDLWMKTRWLEEKKPGRSLVMASGTPVTNTLAELFSVQRFMAPQVLEERGLDEFDAWASMFGQEHTEIEADASGKYAPVTRFSKFVNVPELTQMFREFADVLTSDHLAAMLGDKRPKVQDGSRKIVITPQTSAYQGFKRELADRLAVSRAWKPSRDEPNNPDPVIKIIGDGRLASIDMRFINPSLANDPDSKLNRMADEVIRVFKETANNEYKDKEGKVEPNKGSTQIVFSDLGFGAGVAENRGFNARAWFEKRLRDAGVPPAQVAFMSDHKKSQAKLKLFKDINAGRVRIVVGSSKNMGTGVNAQQRLIALHHLDTPWYPADLEQREGRIVRQGNKNPLVQLYAYSTKGSYDAVMWQMLASKQRFIDQALSGDSSVRSIDDLSESSQFQIATAMTSDDERAIQLAGLRAEIEKLQRLYRAHEEQRARMKQEYDWAGETIRINTQNMQDAKQAAGKVQNLSGDNFTAKADGRSFDVRKEFGEALMARFKDYSDKLGEAPVKIGEISGFDIMALGRTGQGQGYRSVVFVDLPEPVSLTEAATADPVGVALKATNALANLSRLPAQMQQKIDEAAAKRNALEARITAPFPMAEMLSDKIREAQDLETAMLADQNKLTGLEREQQLEDIWQQKTEAITPLFSRGNGAGMAMRDLSAVVDRVSKRLKNLPKVHVLESPAALSTKDPVQKALRDFIRKAGAWEDAEGATHEGEIYLFASGLADEARAEHVLAVHEVTHYGLRGAIGKDLDAALQNVWMMNAKVRKAAAALKQRNGLQSNIEATEEVMADMTPGDLVKLQGWRRVLKAVRDWLGRAGFDKLAARVDTLLKSGLDGQQQADLMVADLVTAARDWVKNGKGSPYMEGTRLADGSLAEDATAQEKWLTREAKASGYASIDEMAEKNYKAFENLAKLWRDKHPADALLSRNPQGQFELVDIKTGKVVGGPYSSMQRARAWRERRDQEYGAIRYQIREIETGRPRLSRANAPSTVAQRAEEIISKPVTAWRPIDAVARMLTTTVRLDRLTSAVYDRAAHLLDRYTPESVKAGVVSDYGVPESVLDQRTLMQGRMRVQLRKSGELIDKLATLTRAESRVAYEWMNNNDPQASAYFEAQLPEESIKVMEEVKDMIDKLSQEAVALGQLDPEVFKRNRFEYLRRSYIKHTTELTKSETAGRKRAIAILGDQYKGRGMTDAVDMAKFKNVAPEWWGRKLKDGQADKGMKGEKFIRLERRAPAGEGVGDLEAAQGPGETNPQKKGRLLEVAYWPAGEPLPAKYSTWDQSGTWEVRDTKGGKLIVWRDFTKAERVAMGEIDEARYAIAKSLHGMIHDVETGRYLEWLAQRYAKKPGEAIDGEIVDASERMRDTFAPGEWVQVPETKIPGTSVLKYGKLAGLYLPGPIWNDVRQTVGFRFKPLGETYAAILGAWKTAKTALSPAVHTNNVMANFVMADWHDVSASHILKALRIILGASQREGKGIIGRTGNAAARAGIVDAEAAREIINRFLDSGANLGSWVTAELQKDQLEPLLAALEKEIGTVGESAGTMASISTVLQLFKAKEYRQAAAQAAISAKNGAPGKFVVGEAKSLIDLYEAEDQVFRLAAWLKAKEDGAADSVAGKIARRSFLDYHINAPWIQAMRNTAFPFISFTYRAVPMMLEVAAKKPHKIMKLAMMAAAVNALGYLLSGGDEDDERRLLPEEKAGGIWGVVPKLVRMPWNDAHGAPVFLDIRRFVPVGDIFDTGQTHSAIPLLPFAVPGGPLALVSELVANKSQFTGRAITLETDTPAEKAEKVADHLYKAFAPNIVILPGTHAFTGVVNAGTGRTDSFGREQSVAQAGLSAFGIKVGSYPDDVLQLNMQRQAQGQMMEIDRQLTQLKRERSINGIDDDEFADERDALIVKKRGIAEDLQRRLAGR